jgi:hypothetical protein
MWRGQLAKRELREVGRNVTSLLLSMFLGACVSIANLHNQFR